MFATKEGTKLFAERALTNTNIHVNHFKDVFGLKLTSIGLGTYLGEPNEETDNKLKAAIKSAIRSRVINVIDTAINYRFQRSEKVIGATLTELFNAGEISRENVFISTKCGYIAPEQEKYYYNINEYIYEEIIHSNICRKEDIINGIHSMSPSFLEFQLEQSLKNLKVEGIDLLYLHNAAEEQLEVVNRNEFYDKLVDVFIFFEKMRDIRRIKWYGLATWDSLRVLPNHPHYINLERVVAIAKEAGGADHGFKFVQLPVNFVYHQAISLKNQYVQNTPYTLMNAAQKLGIRVFTSAPLLEGELLKIDKYPRFNNLNTVAQNAIQFARSAHPAIASTLIGMRSNEHLVENLDLAKYPLATPAEIEQAFKGL